VLVPASSRVPSSEVDFVHRLVAPWQAQHAAVLDCQIWYRNWFQPDNGVD
jgi:hypothetical protein